MLTFFVKERADYFVDIMDRDNKLIKFRLVDNRVKDQSHLKTHPHKVIITKENPNS